MSKYIRFSVVVAVLMIPFGSEAVEPVTAPAAAAIRPDLVIGNYVFGSPKVVRVRVDNIGTAPAAPTTLELTVYKINGIKVARTTSVSVPPIAVNGTAWVSIDTSSILPKFVDLEDTDFELMADADGVLFELKEKNNFKFHDGCP